MSTPSTGSGPTAEKDPIIDQEERYTVSSTGLDRTLFVEAGAGTGKTSQLVSRIVNLVLTEGVSLRNIAAITFTEAAAAELQARIRARFEQEAARAEQHGDTARLQRCREAIAEADLAAISTLHGFASRLLGEFAVDAGLPPRVAVLDEISSQLAHEQRWERFVDELYDDPANHEALERALLLRIPLEARYGGQSTLKDVAYEFGQNWDRIDVLADAPPPELSPVDFAEFDAAVEAVAALPGTCADPSDKFYLRLVEDLVPQMQAVAAIDEPGRKLRALGSVAWTTGNVGSNANWGGDAKGCRDLVRAANDAAAEVRQTAADEVLRFLLVHIAREVRAAAHQRRLEGGLEFHDLLVLAREMLRTSEHASRVLHGRYTHLLLDEFQDTDPIQIELAMLIAASISGQVPEHWSELDVEDGRLFFVGDPKQSIYRFRRADIALFLAARSRFDGDGRVLQLVTNFRTVAPILDWVNALFSHLMAEEVPAVQPRYERLSAHRAPDSGADHRPVLLGGPHPDPKVKADVLRDAEATEVAAALADVRDRPDAWPVHDDRDGSWRPARLSDVAVLVPARTSVPFLRAALEHAGIPYRLATGTLVYDTQEVRDALAAVRAIDDPSDQLSLVAALRSPLYACSDVDLFDHRAAGGRWDLRREPPDGVPADHPVRLGLAHLRSLWEQRWWLGPAALLERLLRERQAALLAFGDPRPKEVWHRLRFLVDQARSFEEAGGGDLRAFVDWSELQGADSARVHEPLLPETDDDAVRILTVHGSKGLEFPITVLSGMTTKPRGRRAGVSVLWEESGPPEVSLRKGVATAGHEPRADLEVEMDQHEKLRLLYVAATRARDHLVVSCHHKPTSSPDTYGSIIWHHFQDHPELWRPFDASERTAADAPDATRAGSGAAASAPAVPASASPTNGHAPAPAEAVELPFPASPDERRRWVEQREALLAPHRTPRVVSATTVARQALGEDLPDEDDDAADTGDGSASGTSVTPRRRGRAGTAIGRAVHATLQALDLGHPAEVTLQVQRQCDLEAIPDHAPTVEALVRSALGSDAVRSAAGESHHKELFVAAPLGERVIEGYVDLLVETPDGLVVIDYKTDTVSNAAAVDEKLAAYELQGASYAAALEAVTGQPVVDCRFVFCTTGDAIERSVRDLRSAIDRVRELLDA